MSEAAKQAVEQAAEETPVVETRNWAAEFEAADAQDTKSYEEVPDGDYVGTIAKDKKTGGNFVHAEPKLGKVRFALTVSDGDQKGRWVFGEVRTQNPRELNNELADYAAKGLRFTARALKALTGNAEGVGLAGKQEWSTAELTEYVEAILKKATAEVAFSKRTRVKDGETVVDKNGKARYTVYVNRFVQDIGPF